MSTVEIHVQFSYNVGLEEGDSRVREQLNIMNRKVVSANGVPSDLRPSYGAGAALDQSGQLAAVTVHFWASNFCLDSKHRVTQFVHALFVRWIYPKLNPVRL